jgi:hypothetical protein
MAKTGSQSDFDDRETEEEPSSPKQTQGFTHGGVMNPSRVMHGVSPTRRAADFLLGMTDGFGPYGPELDSGWVRHQNIFGAVDSTRGVITSKGLVPGDCTSK